MAMNYINRNNAPKVYSNDKCGYFVNNHFMKEDEKTMATQEKRGWCWTSEENDWIKTWHRNIRTQHNQLTEQLKRYKSSLPMFYQEVSRIGVPLLKTIETLLSLNRDRIYQSISPEEAASTLNEVHKLTELLSNFIKRPDVQTAIREFNRKVETQKSDLKKKSKDDERRIIEYLNSQEFSGVLDTYVLQITKHTDILCSLNRPDYGVDTDRDDQRIIQRLAQILFIRCVSCYWENSSKDEELIQFLTTHSNITINAVLKQIIYIMMKDVILHPRPGRSPGEVVAGGLGIVFMDVDKIHKEIISDLENENKKVKDLDKKHFLILGSDFSVAARPE